jgi:hypothetical protein
MSLRVRRKARQSYPRQKITIRQTVALRSQRLALAGDIVTLLFDLGAHQ